MASPDFPGFTRFHPRLTTLLVLVTGITLTLTSWRIVGNELRRSESARFGRLRDRVAAGVVDRFRSVEQALYAGRALVDRPAEVSHADWADFARQMDRFFDRQVVGLGFVERVERSGLAALEARVRADGLPGFTVQRDGTLPQAYVVTHLEPREANEAALGLDIGAGNTRRLAAERAMMTGQPVISGRIQLVAREANIAGSLLLLPVYQGGLVPPTEKGREAALRGWVYASIRGDLLMAGVADAAQGLIDMEVFDGDGASADARIYDSDGVGAMMDPNWPGPGDLLSGESVVPLYGHTWTLRMRTLPAFASAATQQLPWFLLGSGLVGTLLGAGLCWALVNSRARALSLAERMTADLRQAETQAGRLAVVARHATISVVLMDAEWRIEWVNESFTRYFGYSPEEVIGRRPSDVLHGPATSPETLEMLNRELEAGRDFRGEILNYAKDGTTRWLALDVQPLRGKDGRVTGYMGLQLDITERKQQADELHRAMDVARRADQAKGQFLAMMSHEIRTPMNGVIGMTSLLADSPLNRDQRDYVETIRQSGDALLTIIDEILDFSKIESGRLELELEEFDLRSCLESALDLLAPKAAEKQLDLLYEIDERVPHLVRSDQARLRQIIVNLVGNAVKFTLRGEVVLGVRAAARPDGRIELRFTVRDSGIGIAPESLPRLFQSFSQLEASTSRRFGGTGLGLAISKRLAELLGGAMWVESVLGQGSTFHFTVVTEEVPERASPAPADARRGVLAGLRILIVDDNATSRRILGALATRWGMAPQGAESGAEALGWLESGRQFDVAIVDMQMPVMDGAALARAIRRLGLPAPLPILLLCHAGQREQLTNPDMFAECLAKPAKPSQVLDVLLRLFQERSMAAARSAVPSAPRMIATRQAERVLVAEDNRVNLKVALLMLKKLGFEPDVVGDGIEVIEAVRRQHYDIILMDVQMPGMDGLEATRRIRAGAAGRPDPVWIIAVTANAMEGDRETCMAAGMNDYVTKPINILELEWALVRAHHALTSI
jgi:PAS domain S-box-containing protein